MQLVGCPCWPIFHWLLAICDLPFRDDRFQAVRVILTLAFQQPIPFLSFALHSSGSVQGSGCSRPLLRLPRLDLGDVTQVPFSSDELLALPAVVGTTDMLLVLLSEIKAKFSLVQFRRKLG